MTKMKRVLSLLLAVLMVAGLILVPVSADGESTGETDYAAMGAMNVAYAGGKTENVSGLEMSKYFTQTGPDTGVLTLEVYSTGERVTTTVEKEVPTDIVLVLDQSGSMDYCIYCGKSQSGNSHNHSAYTAVTTVSTGKSYYILSGGSYQEVSYCDGKHGSFLDISCSGGAGWYCYIWKHTASAKITPKTTDTPDGTQFYEAATVGFKSRLDSLKDAVKEFTDAVAEKAKGADGKFDTADDIKHRIAVVGFASDDSKVNNEYQNYTNTELFIGATQYKYANATHIYLNSSSTYPAEAYYAQAFQDMNTQAGYDNVIASKDALDASGGTATNLGTEMANKIFDAYKNDYKDSDRAKVVIVFTDGLPGIKSAETDSVRTDDYAEPAINNTYISKNTYGAKVYTVGVFNDANNKTPGELTDLTTWSNSKVADKFMHLMSSDYPEATSMSSYGTMNSTTGYYLAANDAEALTNIFQTISDTIDNESTSTELSSDTILQDVVSGYFDIDIPEGQTAAEAITVQKIDYAGDGLWNTPEDLTAGVTVDGNQIQVTGFNYKNEWVGLDNGTPHGSKLVLTIPVKENGTGFGDNLPTNGENSAILPGGSTENAIPFECPLVNFPYFTVTHIQSRVKTSADDTKAPDDTEIGENYGENEGSYKYRVYGNENFNLTNWVNKDSKGNQITVPDATLDHGEDYLYGGAFSDKDCTMPYFENGEAMDFTPVENAEYFIWEVPGRYLDPASYDVYHRNTNELLKHYMLVNVDRENYSEVGFTVLNNDDFEDVYVSGTDNAHNGLYADDGTLYGEIQVERWNVGYTEKETYDHIYLNNGKFKFWKNDSTLYDSKDEGLIGGYRLTEEMLAALKEDSFTFQPYWITLDGVRVTGHYSLTSTKLPSGATKADWTPTTATCTVAAAQPETQAMAVMAVFCIDDAEPVETVSLTVHDNGSVYTQSIDETLSYAGAEGKLFAGWFLDEDYTTPVDFESISESTDVYAKYVSDAYLQVKYNKLGLFRVSGVSLVSAVDEPDSYAEVGILVNGEPVSVSQSQRYMLLFTAASLFDGASRSDTLLTAQLSLSGSGSLEVTPYWVTLDGTTVYGQSRTLTYTARSIQG